MDSFYVNGFYTTLLYVVSSLRHTVSDANDLYTLSIYVAVAYCYVKALRECNRTSVWKKDDIKILATSFQIKSWLFKMKMESNF